MGDSGKKKDKEQAAAKGLCKLVKGGLLADSPEQYRELVNNPRFVCRKCGRVANREENLCRPTGL
ncbi:hypothetical protein [Desulfurivibrio alkaliphilus]|uniref:Uncharacterized protein n=1 Tax=Desulfurivibrio alkaliphilus (strain DSM 19089 / UNIQEM U267 / AHT2) TaxID=589865 RepID=D6Z621_DESAT|nr:hypothetical protein [Desulfurivibrio alkaliphilus]ADH84903.1 conserved hypothetical protein [Desulfurivibrio alkaliphilus AHT 2]